MKKTCKISSGTLPLCHWLPTVLIIMFSTAMASGQGFFKAVNTPCLCTISPERILCLPGGEFVLPMHDVDHGPIAWAQVDANGNKIFSKFKNLSLSQVQTFVVTNDGNYLIADTTFNQAAPSQHFLKLSWYDFNGSLLQTQNYIVDPIRGYDGRGKIISDDVGNFYFAGMFTNATNQTMAYAIKFDPNGNILWQAPLMVTWSSINTLVLAQDGSLLIDYSNVSGARDVLRKDLNTGQAWSIPIGSTQQSLPMAGDANGNVVLCTNANIFFTNAAQTVTWTKSMPTLLNDPSALFANFCMPVTGGWFFFTTTLTSIKMFKIDPLGNLLWVSSNSILPPGFSAYTAGKELPDGSLVFGVSYAEQPWLLKISADGILFPHNIMGNIVHDQNNNCLSDLGDTPLKDRIVTATRQSDGLQLIGLTDINGHYDITNVDTGTYVVQVAPQTYQWLVCGTPDTITFSDPNLPGTAVANFELQLLYECPLLWANLSTSPFIVCQISTFALKYCNDGTQEATDAFVELTLPIEFSIISSTAPYTLVAPNKLHFEVGDVAIDDCETIYVDAILSCDPALSGQTLCASAAAYPDTTCSSNFGPWSGANIQVAGHCDPDSVRFEIINNGTGSMPDPLDFIIVEDHVISLQAQFVLTEGASKTITLPRDGSTWRIKADQEPYHPLGTEPVSVAVEGCASNGNTFSTGMVNLFSNNFGGSSTSTTCQEVLNGFDPNEKLAFPIGVHDEHFIEPNTSIDYQINFQNTGTASTTNVLLKDTLSTFLDITSLRMGASSHPYTWSLSGPGILQVRFDNINLPDSSSNEPESHGFVTFKIAQQPDNPLGTTIENQAGIYFDSNPVVITNKVFHTIGKDFLEVVATTEPNGQRINVSVIPNPALETARIKFEKIGDHDGTQTFILFDNAGKPVQTQVFTGTELLFKRAGLPGGAYYFHILDAHGVPLASGKLILN